MLVLPNLPAVFRVIGIDPGTDTLGVSVLDVDLLSARVSLIDAFTLRGSANMKSYPMLMDVHGDRYAKVYSHFETIKNIFWFFHPHSVICESPYMGKFATAFEALVECKMMIRRALVEYDATKPLHLIDPPSAKIAVGAPGKGGDKNTVRDAIIRLTNLDNPNNIEIILLDEHSTDAIAVGYYQCIQILDWLKRSNSM